MTEPNDMSILREIGNRIEADPADPMIPVLRRKLPFGLIQIENTKRLAGRLESVIDNPGLTTDEYSKMWNVSRSHAARILNSLMGHQMKVRTDNGRWWPV